MLHPNVRRGCYITTESQALSMPFIVKNPQLSA